ncbi:unnamed protein product [Prunus armeniaca]
MTIGAARSMRAGCSMDVNSIGCKDAERSVRADCATHVGRSWDGRGSLAENVLEWV